MADDPWVKDQLIKQAQTQTEILGKLDQGHDRMGRIEESIAVVVEATTEFPTLKISVAQLETAERLRVKEEQLKVKQELDEMKAQKAMWGERLWGLFVKAAPFILIAIAFIYTQIKDEL